MEKIRLIEGSLKTLGLGWYSLIPVAGVFFAVGTIMIFARTITFAEGQWNPAKAHLLAGMALALLSLLGHGLLLAAAAWGLMMMLI